MDGTNDHVREEGGKKSASHYGAVSLKKWRSSLNNLPGVIKQAIMARLGSELSLA